MPPDMSRPGLTKQGSRKLLEAGYEAFGSLLNMTDSRLDVGGSRSARRGQRDIRRTRAPRAEEESLYPSLQMIDAIPQVDADTVFSQSNHHRQRMMRSMDDLSLSGSERSLSRTPSLRQLTGQNSLRNLMRTPSQRSISPFRSTSNRSLAEYLSNTSEHAKLSMKQCDKSFSSMDSEKSWGRESARWRSTSKEYSPVDTGSCADYSYEKKTTQSVPKSPSSSSKEYSGYGTSMEDLNAKMKARGVPRPQPSSSSSPTPSPSQLQIEVTPGVFMNVLGSAETSVAIQTNYLASTYCICCNLALYCIRDAGYVLCPDCRVVSPVEMGDDNMTKFSAGVGLGITVNDLARWQSELNCAPRQSYPQRGFGY